MNRFTFVIQIQPDGPSTLENLSTQERIPVADLAVIAPQIEVWLESLAVTPGETGSSSGREAG